MTGIIILIISILFGSALISMTEAALFSISLGKAMALAKNGSGSAKLLVGIKERMSRPIATLVIINNVINIVGSIFVGVMAGDILGEAWIGWLSGILTFLIIIFAEIIPKNIGESYAEHIALGAARPVYYLTKLFSPLVFITEKIVSPFTARGQLISEDEIKILSNLAHMSGSIESDEKEMIENVFRLNDQTARAVMTPRKSMFALPGTATVGERRAAILKCPYSRVPIYGKDKDEIIGMCMETDLLSALIEGKAEMRIGELKRPVIFVSDKTRLDFLLRLFQRKKMHLAIVKDEFDATVGVVTLEDVLEQLVGEIVDEEDMAVDPRTEAIESARQAREKNQE